MHPFFTEHMPVSSRQLTKVSQMSPEKLFYVPVKTLPPQLETLLSGNYT